jgi:transketolase
MALEPFSEQFPARFFNLGVAEQNMVGMAAGLAEAGFLPFVYSITPFAVLRAYEFIRNGPIHHQFSVRIVGVGGGLEYGHNGLSHYGLEDVAVLRIQPSMAVVAPADYQQAETALRACWDLTGPVYFRLGKDEGSVVPGLDGRYEHGRLQEVRQGADLLLISMGNVGRHAAEAAARLAERGVECTVAVVASVSPPPISDLVRLLTRFPAAMTVEAHYASGGLGSLVSEIVAENGIHCRVIRNAVHSKVDGRTGSEAFMLKRHGLSSDALVAAAVEAVQCQNSHSTPRSAK